MPAFSIRSILSVFITTLCLYASTFTTAGAHEYKVDELRIIHPWSRATFKGARVAAGYMTIINHGKQADRLLGVSSELSDKTEIHLMEMKDGLMKMRPMPEGVEIAPGAEISFKPGSYHIMFMNIARPLEQGKNFKGRLIFEKAGTVEVDFAIDSAAAKTPSHGHDDMPEHQH
ncbi:MAG: Hypothetical protein BHV28_04070 [Candidatus Tokpelaia hoelldobleri]|uniref:Copper chaperone PCu(A)C n=1 Tax=Candidatus Tokpelaia hoelldobleri TaxID=1902579 RepID=A0A1U9JTD7_9HYPH|nr:MAG: Hypothetical protein BHV28_04070 [Candidatus Tokpelaia hoelldoblerii]